VLTNTKIVIFKETYPEDKLTEHDQDNILEELGKVLRGTPRGELPHPISHRLEGGALLFVCAEQQYGQWLIRAIDNYRLGTGAILKATARNLPKPVKVALRTRGKVAQSHNELLGWIHTYGGSNRELIVASAYLPYDADEPPPTTAIAGRSNSLWDVMLMHTTSCGEAPAPTQEENALWNISSVRP
jgi:hypothetical protein